MRLESTTDATAAARVAATEIGARCREAVAARGRALLAVSGGDTPWLMLRELCTFALPWSNVFVAQVDERVAPDGDPRRNLTRLEQILVREGPLAAAQLLRMPVMAQDLDEGAAAYQQLLESVGGTPLVLDLVHLGLGTDGHTASLVPGDPVLDVRDRDVAVSDAYQGLRRMTLTYPAINRARRRLWLVTGTAKSTRLRELEEAEKVEQETFQSSANAGNRNAPIPRTAENRNVPSSPSLRVTRDDTIVVADEAALRGDRSPG